MVVATFNKSKRYSAETVYYKLLKAVLNIKSRPSKVKLLALIMGNAKDYLAEYFERATNQHVESNSC